MSPARTIPDSTPTRAQLRLVVLSQWVQAGLDLARGAGATRGLLGGAVALWRIFLAIRLATQLAGRLSEAAALLSNAPRETAPGDTAAGDQAPDPHSGPASDDPPAAACLRDALSALMRTIREALGLAPDRRGPTGAVIATPAKARSEPPHALGRATSPPERPPDRPPGPERSRARRRRPSPSRAPNTLPPPIATPAFGRFRLAAA